MKKTTVQVHAHKHLGREKVIMSAYTTVRTPVDLTTGVSSAVVPSKSQITPLRNGEHVSIVMIP
jgi:hypothetical protein